VQQIVVELRWGVYTDAFPLWVNRVDFAMSAIGPLTLQKRTCGLAIDPLVLSMIQALLASIRLWLRSYESTP
jgi:hypothetical protein